MKKSILLFAASLSLLAVGCHRDMWIQAKIKPQRQSPLFSDQVGSRIVPEGAVEFGLPKNDTEYYTGYTADGKLVKTFPIPVDKELLERGKERYTIFCTPCHGQLGDGNGMIAQRGYNVSHKVASYQTQRMQELPIGHVFDVITSGYGAMFPFGARIDEHDRWAIAAYVRVLQRSRNIKAGALSPEDQAKVDAGTQLHPPVEHHEEGGH